jgi:plastocyanin
MSIRIALAVLALILPGAAAAATVDVDIKDFEYQPASLTIAVNDIVRWTNRGAFAHTVTSDTAAQFESGELITKAQFTHTFMTPGTYPYHCLYHPTMTGTVTVLARALHSLRPSFGSATGACARAMAASGAPSSSCGYPRRARRRSRSCSRPPMAPLAAVRTTARAAERSRSRPGRR